MPIDGTHTCIGCCMPSRTAGAAWVGTLRNTSVALAPLFGWVFLVAVWLGRRPFLAPRRVGQAQEHAPIRRAGRA